MEDSIELLKKYINEEEKFNKFIEFIKLYKETNEKINISSITDENEIIVKHFIDSLEGSKYINDNSFVIEIGSGGGFPSIPLMIDNETLRFLLVESIEKKCNFLKENISKLKLNGNVVCERAEVIGKNKYREKGDFVVARAVAKLNTLYEYCLPIVKVGGYFIAYKSNNLKEEIEESTNALITLGGKIKEIHNYNLPLNMGERNLVIIEKIKETPKEYPRGNGKERKKPL